MPKQAIIIETIRANESMNKLLLLVCNSDNPDIFYYNELLNEHIEHIRLIHVNVKSEIAQFIPA